MSDGISAVINFHAEGELCIPAMLSALDCVQFARDHGVDVELIGVLDNADVTTRTLVERFEPKFAQLHHVSYRDLGESRNHGARVAQMRNVAFFDGDDLWGQEWLHAAYKCLRTNVGDTVYHPEIVYYFDENDFLSQSQTIAPSSGVKSFLFVHPDTRDQCFDAKVIHFNNIFTSNSAATRDLYLRYPFLKVERGLGFGVEDWTWNATLMAAGVHHVPVPGTVHLVRVKTAGSLGASNHVNNLLPKLYELELE